LLLPKALVAEAWSWCMLGKDYNAPKPSSWLGGHPTHLDIFHILILGTSTCYLSIYLSIN